MTEQADRGARTSIALDWPTRDRLAELTRQINAKEHVDLSAAETVAWALDRLDVLDLP